MIDRAPSASPQVFPPAVPTNAGLLPLIGKLLRDLRWPFLATGTLVFVFPFLWAFITKRILSQIAPFFDALGQMGGINSKDFEAVLFSGPGQLMKTLIGGDRIDLSQAMDFLSVCLVHPAMQMILALWAIARSTQAIAGEVDRGTMELLLAQPISRFQVWLSHLLVETGAMALLAFLPVAGLALGAWYISPLKIEAPDLKALPRKPGVILEVGPFRMRMEDPLKDRLPQPAAQPAAQTVEGAAPAGSRLEIRPLQILGAFPQVFGLMIAISGFGIILSVLVRRRFVALGIGVMLVLSMFLINLLGQLWEPLAPLRPLTAFYYYLPQEAGLGRQAQVDWSPWTAQPQTLAIATLPVQLAVAAVGWVIAWAIFRRKDIPAPL